MSGMDWPAARTALREVEASARSVAESLASDGMPPAHGWTTASTLQRVLGHLAAVREIASQAPERGQDADAALDAALASLEAEEAVRRALDALSPTPTTGALS